MSRPPARRPTLLPSVRRLWRGANQLQLGTDPGRAVMLELTDPASARVLDLLDGTRTEQVLMRETARLAIPAPDVRLILGELRQAGYVVDAHTLRPPGSKALGASTRRRLEHEAAALAFRRTDAFRRSDAVGTPANRLRRRLSAQVLVTGTSQIALPIANALACAGVGHLDPMVFAAADSRGDNDGGGAAELVRRIAPEVRLAPITRGRASFAVLVGMASPASLTALAHRRLAHLAVIVRDATVVVGPLVRPGLSPCLNCLDLHRVDRDPAWRLVSAQLSDAPYDDAVATTTVLAAAAFAAEEVLTHIDGGTPKTLGATVEIAGPGRHNSAALEPAPGLRLPTRTADSRDEAPSEAR